MPLVTPQSDEAYCRQSEPETPLDQCLSTRAEVSARIADRDTEIESRCSAAFPKDITRNNECRTFCWARNDDAASCTLEVTTFLNNRRDFEVAQRNHLLAMSSLVILVIAIVAILVIKRTRSAIWRSLARGIYAASGFDVRKIRVRWDGYHPQDRENSHPQITSSETATISAVVPTSDKKEIHRRGGPMVMLLNIGRVLMWLWIINGVGRLLLGPDVLSPIQQPFYMFACMLQVIAAIAFLSLMTRAIRRRKHATPTSSADPPTGDGNSGS